MCKMQMNIFKHNYYSTSIGSYNLRRYKVEYKQIIFEI